MILKIDAGQFRHGLVEGRINSILGFRSDLMASTGVKLLGGFIHMFVEVSTLIEFAIDFRQSSNAGTEFLLEGWFGVGVSAGGL
jgi:hypothetical protein